MLNINSSSVISGIDIINWFYFGAQEVISDKNYLNNINLFPVADGDTGSNLSATLSAMAENPEHSEYFNKMISSISESGLCNARGNSGIIFASYVNGMAIASEPYEEVDIQQFSLIAHKAVEHLYSSIGNPVEGTIITVIRDWALFLHQNYEKYKNFRDFFLDAYGHALSSLEKTKYQMEILKKNKVVDSGAAGFVKFLNGINRFYSGTQFEANKISTHEEILSIKTFEENNEYRFCFESSIEILSDLSNEMIANQLKCDLKEYGDSLIVAFSGKKAKIHIHTDFPELVTACLKRYGTFIGQKADDIKLQTSIKSNRKHKIGIITDSVADIPDKFKLDNQVHTLPMSIMINDSVYLDKVSVTPKLIFSEIKSESNYPTSSLPQPGRIGAMLEYLSETYDSLIFIVVASSLSGTYNAIVQEIKKANRNIKIDVIDSRLNSGAEGLIVKKAVDLLNEGIGHSEIVSEIRKLIPKTKIYVCLETLKYAVRSGRVSNTVGTIGIKIGLRPIMTLDENGNGKTFGIAFSKKGITRKIMNLVKNTVKTSGIQSYSIVHCDNLKLALEYKIKMTELTGIEPSFIEEVSSVIAMHSGTGTVAVCFTEK